jgi:redox-sensitive bicupin YhaK (pirin superfamily)
MKNVVQIKQVIKKQKGSPAYIRGSLFEQLKPFALFDAGIIPKSEMTIGWHPHSGVATITFPYNAKLNHADSEGNGGTINSRGLQWMASGSGVWHKESYVAEQDHIGILQLWLLLPPDEETTPVRYFNLQPNDIPQFGHVRILLGEYQGIKAVKEVSHNVTYLHINLRKGQSFNWLLPEKQTRGFVYSLSGSLVIDREIVGAEQFALLKEVDSRLAVSLSIVAETACEFVLGLTEPWPHPVMSHYGQIHTNEEALMIGSKRIQTLGNQLVQQGEIQ